MRLRPAGCAKPVGGFRSQRPGERMHQTVINLGLMDDDAIALDEAALALAALDHPDIDLTPYRERLSAMTAQLGAYRDSARDAAAQAAALAQVIAGRHGFLGDRDSYDDPGNADLIVAMERRRGLPVTLSILYVALARRVGWTAVALNTPGHLLVCIGAQPAPVLIDPFNAGAVVDRAGLLQLLARSGGDPAQHARQVAPLSNQATLLRLLLNQSSRARAAGELERALTIYQRMTTIAPLNTALWRERAELEQQVGQLAAARLSLHAALETTRDQRLRALIQQRLELLARSRH